MKNLLTTVQFSNTSKKSKTRKRCYFKSARNYDDPKDATREMIYEVATTNLHERINFKALGRERRDISTFKYADWANATNGIITKPFPEKDFLNLIEQHTDTTSVDPMFLKLHEGAGRGIQEFKDAFPSVDATLSNEDQLNELLRLHKVKDLLRRFPPLTHSSNSNLNYGSSLLSLANFYLSSRVDEKMSITPIAYCLLDCTGFNRLRFDTVGEASISFFLSDKQGASGRVDFVTSLKLDDKDGVKMPANPALPFIISSGIENKVWKISPDMPGYMGQIAMQSLIIAARNYAGYGVNVPVPMTLLVGSFCRQFLFLYEDDYLTSIMEKKGKQFYSGYCIPIGHKAHHQEEGLSLLAKGERNDAMWGMHALSKYLAQPLGCQLNSEQLIKILKNENVLALDEKRQDSLVKLPKKN